MDKPERPVERIVGWNCFSFREKKAKKILLASENHSIIELDSGELCYFAKLPELTLQEALVLKKMTRDFQGQNLKKKPEDLESFIENYCVEKSILLDSEQRKYFEKILESRIFGFSALDFFLNDPAIEEISVIGIGRKKPVFVFHREFGWVRTNVFFGSEIFVRDLANKMARKIGRRLTLECPKLNANLPDGSRLTAIIPPISEEASLTIRKFRAEPFTAIDLVENNTFSSEFCAFIWLALELECSFLIAGNTGSGKTSTLNCLLGFVPKQERIILVEETPEIVLPHEHCVKMTVVKEQGFDMHSLIIDTLRMRPDRVVVGEIRNNCEAIAFMDTLLAGQGRGSYGTFHAQCGKEAIARLKSFGIKELDLAAIDLLLVQRRWAQHSGHGFVEKRRIVEALEIGFSGECAETRQLFGLDFQRDCLEKTGESEKVFSKARDFLGFDRKKFLLEIEKRKKFLDGIAQKKVLGKDFFEMINKPLAGVF